MDFTKLFDFASRLDAPGLIASGLAFAAEVKAAAARTPGILSSADRAELDAIHADALAAADRLDATLAAAEKR